MEEYDAIVIGCGISGLLAGLALSKEGKRVLMLEKDNQVGGVCRSYNVDAFTVDTGPHIITGLGEGPIQLLMDNYFDMVPKFIKNGEYFVRFGDAVYTFPWTIPEWLSFSPFQITDRLNIVRALLELMADYASGKNLDEKAVVEYTGHYPFSKRVLRFIDSICIFLTGVGMKDTPVSRILSSGRNKNKTNAKKIKEVLLEGGKVHHYPKGGIQSIVNALLQSLPKNAEIRTDETATQVVIENGSVSGVVTDKGEYAADIVVYAGPNKTLPELVKLPESYNQRFTNLKQARTLTLWLGLDKKNFLEIESKKGSFTFLGFALNRQSMKAYPFPFPSFRCPLKYHHSMILS